MQGRPEEFPDFYCHRFYSCHYPAHPREVSEERDSESFQLVRYYGWYSNRGRSEREKQKAAATALLPAIPARVEIIDVSEYRPQKIPSPQWRECFKRVWEVNPLVCPKCGNEMKIISFINEADVIRR
jgi:hypothetical protein